MSDHLSNACSPILQAALPLRLTHYDSELEEPSCYCFISSQALESAVWHRTDIRMPSESTEPQCLEKIHKYRSRNPSSVWLLHNLGLKQRRSCNKLHSGEVASTIQTDHNISLLQTGKQVRGGPFLLLSVTRVISVWKKKYCFI